MSFAFALEALKFHRLKNEKIVRILFLILLAMNAAFYFWPPGDPDLSKVARYISEQLQLSQFDNGSSLFTELPPFTRGNLIYIGCSVLVYLVGVLIGLLYSGAYAAERIGQKATLGLVSMLKAFPKVILLGLIILVPAILSSILMWIPLIIFLSGACFAPLLYSEKRQRLFLGLAVSWQFTYRKKFTIFLSFILISLASDGILMVLALLLPKSAQVIGVLAIFINSVFTLVGGRLLGILYVFFTRQTMDLPNGIVITSDPTEIFTVELRPTGSDVFVMDGKLGEVKHEEKQSGQGELGRMDRSGGADHPDSGDRSGEPTGTSSYTANAGHDPNASHASNAVHDPNAGHASADRSDDSDHPDGLDGRL